jgi:membrane protein implicated in regulation of membrane protease activity
MENLELQQLEGLLFSLIVVIFLILIALIVYIVMANRRQRAKLSLATEAERLAPHPARQLAGQILALVRDEPGGELQVEVAGDRYRYLSEIEDPQIRRQVIGAALELIRFTGVVGETVSTPAPIAETQSWREELRQDSKDELDRIHAIPVHPEDQSQPLSSPAPEDLEEQFLSLLTEMGQTSPSPERPTIVSSLQQRRMPKPAELERSPYFVVEIDAIIQRRVQMIPALVGRDLHVRLGPGDSVRFVFEGREYESLDSLPNMTAQQLIRDSIQEWEDTV